jgi:hypothetical protein
MCDVGTRVCDCSQEAPVLQLQGQVNLMYTCIATYGVQA